MSSLSTALFVFFVCSSCWTVAIALPVSADVGGLGEFNPDFFQGDILGFPPVTVGDVDQNALLDKRALWPNGVMVYQVDTVLSATQQAILKKAIAGYENQTCLRFKQRTNENAYVSIQKTGRGCSSYVGRTGGKQIMSLDDGCWRSIAEPGTVQHEFMHAFGFLHEQSRTDRDDYVTIKSRNIIPSLLGNFDKYGSNVIQSLGTAYDYGSVMHYPTNAFAIRNRLLTIVPKQNGVTIGQRKGLSQNDILKLNRLYNCNLTCSN